MENVYLNDEFPSHKEVYEMFYKTKGHINSTEETIYSCYWGYFKRAWYNEEFYRAGEGFEEEYRKKFG